MIHRKRMLAAVAACAIVALVAVALIATVTQAEMGANWVVKGTNVTALLKPEVGVELEKLPVNGPRHLLLLTKLGETKVEILCGGFVAIGFLLTGGKGSTSAIQLSECATFLNGKIDESCTPKEPIVAKAKSLIVLAAPITLLLFEPEAGGEFGAIKFEAGCFLPEEVAITGSFYVKETNGKLETEEQFHLFEQALGFGGGLFFGNEPMTIDGSGKASLFSPHATAIWKGKGA
ncbi:MAG: hypothetical protein QOF13_1443 [Solirubrobacterales bacterium]|jgi:hypothetical protein|nr:hypothetical protein [Solirubrobacterales bacterium]